MRCGCADMSRLPQCLQRQVSAAAPTVPSGSSRSGVYGWCLCALRSTYTCSHSSPTAGGIAPACAGEEAVLFACAPRHLLARTRAARRQHPWAQARCALPRAANGAGPRVPNAVIAAQRPRRYNTQRRWCQPRSSAEATQLSPSRSRRGYAPARYGTLRPPLLLCFNHAPQARWLTT